MSNSSVLQEALCGAVGKALSVESEGDVRYLRAQSMLMMGSVDSMVELEARSEYDASSTAEMISGAGATVVKSFVSLAMNMSYAGPVDLSRVYPAAVSTTSMSPSPAPSARPTVEPSLKPSFTFKHAIQEAHIFSYALAF